MLLCHNLVQNFQLATCDVQMVSRSPGPLSPMMSGWWSGIRTNNQGSFLREVHNQSQYGKRTPRQWNRVNKMRCIPHVQAWKRQCDMTLWLNGGFLKGSAPDIMVQLVQNFQKTPRTFPHRAPYSDGNKTISTVPFQPSVHNFGNFTLWEGQKILFQFMAIFKQSFFQLWHMTEHLVEMIQYSGSFQFGFPHDKRWQGTIGKVMKGWFMRLSLYSYSAQPHISLSIHLVCSLTSNTVLGLNTS